MLVDGQVERVELGGRAYDADGRAGRVAGEPAHARRGGEVDPILRRDGEWRVLRVPPPRRGDQLRIVVRPAVRRVDALHQRRYVGAIVAGFDAGGEAQIRCG